MKNFEKYFGKRVDGSMNKYTKMMAESKGIQQRIGKKC